MVRITLEINSCSDTVFEDGKYGHNAAADAYIQYIYIMDMIIG